MDFWYNKIIFRTIKVKDKNEIGQIIEVFKKDKDFKGDIQPMDEKSYKYTWGEDIKSTLQLFADEELSVNEIVVFNNKAYKVEKSIGWDDYFIYALMESDVIVFEKDK